MRRDLQRAGRFFRRAVALKCPECGTRPMFIPLRSVRSFRDWFTPLDGCPRCGYPYERETGYFLLAIWAVNYGVGSLLGIVLYLILETFFVLPLPLLLTVVIVPVCLFNLAFARHAKAFFLAMDHYFDPHRPDGGDDDGGNLPHDPIPPTPSAPKTRPYEPAAPV